MQIFNFDEFDRSEKSEHFERFSIVDAFERIAHNEGFEQSDRLL